MILVLSLPLFFGKLMYAILFVGYFFCAISWEFIHSIWPIIDYLCGRKNTEFMWDSHNLTQRRLIEDYNTSWDWKFLSFPFYVDCCFCSKKQGGRENIPRRKWLQYTAVTLFVYLTNLYVPYEIKQYEQYQMNLQMIC